MVPKCTVDANAKKHSPHFYFILKERRRRRKREREKGFMYMCGESPPSSAKNSENSALHLSKVFGKGLGLHHAIVFIHTK